MSLEDLLGCFNLTHQEAVLYLLLCAEGRLTGYEASKLSGISRSNTYTSLAALVEKGAAWLEEGAATRYTPVPVAEFCDNRLRKMRENRELLVRSVTGPRRKTEGYLTIKGERNIFDKMRNMIDEAQERVYIAVSGTTLALVTPELKQAVDRGLKVVIITSPPFDMEGAMIYLSTTSQEQIRLIADSRNVLTGDIKSEAESSCLYSNKKNLVDLFKRALKNEIELARIQERSKTI